MNYIIYYVLLFYVMVNYVKQNVKLLTKIGTCYYVIIVIKNVN